MSISYVVGGKSLTQQTGRKQSNSAVSGPLNRGKPHPRSPQTSTSTATGPLDHRRGDVNDTRRKPTGEAGTRRRLSDKAAATTSGSTTTRYGGRSNSESGKLRRSKDTTNGQSGSNIVTFSDLKSTNAKDGNRTKLMKNEKLKSSSFPNQSQRVKSDSQNGFSNSSLGTGRKLDSIHSVPSPNQRLNGSLVAKPKTDETKQFSLDYAKSGRSIHPRKTLTVHKKSPSENCLLVQPLGKLRANKTPTKTVARKESPLRNGRSVGGKMSYGGNPNDGLYSSNARRVGQQTPASSQAEGMSPATSQGTPQQQTAEYDGSGGFTRITPNQRRREKLTSQASKELAEYEKRQTERRQIRIEGPAQATGGVKSEEEARLDMERANKIKKYEQIQKRDKWLKEKREREDKEIEEKKARARKTAKENERRRAEREARFVRNDHERTNEGFLQRLEARNSYDYEDSSSSTSQELRSLMEMFPDKDPAKLQEMLDLTQGDVGKVIDLLQ